MRKVFVIGAFSLAAVVMVSLGPGTRNLSAGTNRHVPASLQGHGVNPAQKNPFASNIPAPLSIQAQRRFYFPLSNLQA
jgi:hypothetical protein